MAFDDSSLGSSTLGRVTISCGSGQIYRINLLFDKPFSELTCPVINSEPSILSPNKQDELYHKYDESCMLLSLNKVKAKIVINGVSVKVSFPFDNSIKPITIPIINSLPFGKDQQEQTMSL